MKTQLNLEMEKRVKAEDELKSMKFGEEGKLDGLDAKWEKLMGKYKSAKNENKEIK